MSSIVLTTYGVFAVLLGLVLGSFANVAIVRWPKDRSVVAPRSHCPTCQAPIAWYDNLPLLSWLLLRGRCRHCDASIALSYPLIEALMGALGWLLYVRLISRVSDLDLAHGAAWALFMTFIWMQVVLCYIDLKHRIIPDETSIYAVPLGVFGIAGLQALGYNGPLAIPWQQAVMGAAVGGGFFGALAILWSYVLGREALGWGDVKLMAMIGAFLGPAPGAFIVMLLGSLIGAAVGLVHLLTTQRRDYLPFGPTLALASVLYVLYSDTLTQAVFPYTLP